MFASSKRLLAVAMFTILLILAVNLAWWLFYERTERLLDQQLSRRLSAVAATTALSLPPEMIDSLALGDLDAYLNVTELVSQARAADSLSEVFLLDDNYRYLATTSTGPDSLYFLAELNSPYIDSLLYGLADRSLVTRSYRTGSIILKSAFAPIPDELGTVIAVLGVEASVDYFESLADLKRNLYYSSGISILGGLLFGLLFILVQRRLNSAQQQLFMNETHAYLGRMVAVVAHEIKNPLMIIRASAERLAKKQESTESEFIIEEVDRLNQIVGGYLDFAKSGSGDAVLVEEQPTTIDLHELCANIRRHLQDKYSDDRITWLGPKGADDTAPPMNVACHARSLRQVLLNLLINGVDACRDSSRPIRVGLHAVNDNDGSITLIVSDQGGGMTKKELAHAFDPFYTTKQTGSGLGLYLSRRIVTQLGGRMEVKSRPGHGTEVIIRLGKTPRE
jgi:two-component system, sporulation sensor kinase D